MPIYNGNNKIKDLYYGGTKIKEAYYNGNKVYSSHPLYYCYRIFEYNIYWYLYIKEKPTLPGSYTTYMSAKYPNQASSSADLDRTLTTTILSVTESSFVNDAYYTWDYYQSGDLYT